MFQRNQRRYHVKSATACAFLAKWMRIYNAFPVCPLATEAEVLLGTNVLETVVAKIDLECSTIALTDVGKVPRVYSLPHGKHTALTVFTGGKAGRSPQLSQQKTLRRDEQLLADLRPELPIKVGHDLLELEIILL
jgi:hypothetical protein